MYSWGVLLTWFECKSFRRNLRNGTRHQVLKMLQESKKKAHSKAQVSLEFTQIIAFDEGRTLPNLLGCLLSRRFPVHASES